MPAGVSFAPRTLLIGFAAAYLSVLTFHQGTILVLHLLGFAPNFPWSTRPVPAFGLPAIVQLAFWGGLWGCLIAAFRGMFKPGRPRLIYGFLFGAIVCNIVGWYVVAPMKGNPSPAFGLATMWRGLTINGVFGLGTIVFLDLADIYFGKRARVSSDA